MGPFDPKAMTPGMGGMYISLGDYHGTMDAAWAVSNRIRETDPNLWSDEDLATGLNALRAANRLSNADEDVDAPTFDGDINKIAAIVLGRGK